jgi:hypothetical protein
VVLVLAGPKRPPIAPWLKHRLEAREAAEAQQAATSAGAKEDADTGKLQGAAPCDLQVPPAWMAPLAEPCDAQDAAPLKAQGAALCDPPVHMALEAQTPALCSAHVPAASVDQGAPLGDAHDSPPSKAQGTAPCNGPVTPPLKAQGTAAWTPEDASPVLPLAAPSTVGEAGPGHCPAGMLPNGHIEAAPSAFNKGLANQPNAAYPWGKGAGPLEAKDAAAPWASKGNDKDWSTAQRAMPRTEAEVLADLDNAIIARAGPAERTKLLHEFFGGKCFRGTIACLWCLKCIGDCRPTLWC